MKQIKGGVYNTNLLILFNKLAETGKLYSNSQMKGGGLGGGSVEDNTASVTINFNWRDPVWSLIEELSHANGPSGASTLGIGHDVLANAAIAAASTIGINLDNVKRTNTPNLQTRDETTEAGSRYNSVLYRNVLRSVCN